ncbi:AAA family ATPase [Kutzneria sp. 744]|uniref:AAA family ATPase n=1 Tax=Kutzneria sp. (strain 744) TaxID=345341 RepID=UPI0004B9E0A5|nr:AAA family ATPase [Kutzneria sp. 744]
MDRFVGRAAELRRLEYAWRDTARGRLVAVTGPAGVGKTRLCEEASDRARAAGLRVVWGRCWSDGGAPALWPWQPLLADLCGARTAGLLSSEAETVDPERFSRFQAVSNALARAVEHTPTMLVIDDLHAADPAAQLLTRFVAKARLPLALVVTLRYPVTDLGDEALPIMLRPFDPSETRDYLVTHGIERLEAPLTDTIHRLTDGSPLFLRRLIALGAADFAGGLREAIDQSFSQLATGTARLLAMSAILGDSVSSAEAAALLDVQAAQVIDTVECAVQAGLVTTAGTDSFEYSHDLVRRAALSRLTAAELLGRQRPRGGHRQPQRPQGPSRDQRGATIGNRRRTGDRGVPFGGGNDGAAFLLRAGGIAAGAGRRVRPAVGRAVAGVGRRRAGLGPVGRGQSAVRPGRRRGTGRERSRAVRAHGVRAGRHLAQRAA